MTAMPGLRRVIGSVVCATLASAVALLVFGTLEVIAGTVAESKGASLRGTGGVSASFAAVVAGFCLTATLAA